MLDLFEIVKHNWSLTTTMTSIFLTYLWLILDRKYAKKEDFSRLQDAIKQNDKRVTVVEEKIKDLPTSKDFSKLELLMTKVEGELKATNATAENTSRQVSLLVEEKIRQKQ